MKSFFKPKKLISVILSLIIASSVFAVIPITAYAEVGDGVISIDFTPESEIEIFENSKGEWRDEGGSQYYRYNEPRFKSGDILTLNYDGGSVDYTFTTDGFVFENDEGGELRMYDDVNVWSTQEEKHWGKGIENYYFVNFGDLNAKVYVEIIDNPVDSALYERAGSPDFYTESNGEWRDGMSGQPYYEYRIGFNEGDKLTVDYNDGTGSITYTYIWDHEEDCGVFESEYDRIYEDDVEIKADQFQNPWVPGENTYTVEYAGKSTKVRINLIPNPVSSISYTPAAPIEYYENSEGEDRDDDEGEDYFEYHLRFNDGDKLTVTYTDDRGSVEYTYRWDNESTRGVFESQNGDRIYTEEGGVGFYNEQRQNHWKIGENTYWIEYLGVRFAVKATVKKNPVKSISFKPSGERVFFKESDGRWEYDDNGDEYFEYNTGWFDEGDELTVKYSDGRGTIVYTFVRSEEHEGFESAQGDFISANDVDYFSDQRNDHWDIDGDNLITISYMGSDSAFSVQIVESPVDSISYVPAKDPIFYQNANGEWRNDNGEDFFEYRIGFNEGDKLTVNYNDRGSVEYTFRWNHEENRGVFESENENLYEGEDVNINADQYRDHWVLGENTYYIDCLGKSSKVKATVIENPVKAIEAGLEGGITIKEYTNGEWRDGRDGERYFDYRIEPRDGMSITVDYKDGRKVKYSYFFDEETREEGFRNESGDDVLDINFLNMDTHQEETHWVKGGGNFFVVEYMGAFANVPVSIIDDDTVYSGITGGCEWSYDKFEETLTISGDGATADYGRDNESPWRDFHIINIDIGNGVTAIGNDAFMNADITELIIPDSVASIGINAFNGCGRLASVSLPETLKTVGDFAFAGCDIKEIYIPTGVETIKEKAFGYYYDMEKDDDCVLDGFTILADKETVASAYATLNKINFTPVHSFDEGTVTKKADYDKEGVMTYVCTHCGEHKDETIAKLPKTDIKNFKVSGVKNKTYTGKALTQTVTVKNGSKTLKKGTDYTVSYKDNKAAGTAYVIITGTRAYKGTIKVKFTIAKAKNPVKVTAKTSLTVKASAKKTIFKKSLNITKAMGKVTVKTDNKKVTVKDGTITVSKGLKKGKTVKVIITITVKGDTNYASSKIDKTIKIKVK